MLSPGELMPAETGAGLPQLGPDQIAAGVGDVGVADAEDETRFRLEGGEVVEGVGAGFRGCEGCVGAGVGA